MILVLGPILDSIIGDKEDTHVSGLIEQNLARQEQAVPGGHKQSQILLNTSRCFQTLPDTPNTPKYSQMLSNTSGYAQILLNTSRCSETLPDTPRYS